MRLEDSEGQESEASTSSLEEARKASLVPSEGAQPCQQLGVRLLAFQSCEEEVGFQPSSVFCPCLREGELLSKSEFGWGTNITS